MRGVQELYDVEPGGWKRDCKDATDGGEVRLGVVTEFNINVNP
jgi:hypothetical protein